MQESRKLKSAILKVRKLTFKYASIKNDAKMVLTKSLFFFLVFQTNIWLIGLVSVLDQYQVFHGSGSRSWQNFPHTTILAILNYSFITAGFDNNILTRKNGAEEKSS